MGPACFCKPNIPGFRQAAQRVATGLAAAWERAAWVWEVELAQVCHRKRKTLAGKMDSDER